MSVESVIRGVLAADATLLGLASGGIYSFDTTGSEGINRTLTPAAFDSNGVILPCVLVAQRNANPGFAVQDDDGQTMDVRQVVECYVMEFRTRTATESISDRMYTLLHAKMISGAGRVDWAGNVRLGRDIDLDCFTERIDFLTIRIRTGS